MRYINLDIVLGVIIGLGASILFASPWNWERGLKSYQELVVGVLSLAGAAAAVIAVMRQIAHAQEMEDERRARREYAARKMLPYALTALSRYAESCISALNDTKDQPTPLNISTMTLEPISELDVEPIKQLLEFGDRDIQDRISELLL